MKIFNFIFAALPKFRSYNIRPPGGARAENRRNFFGGTTGF